MISRGDIHPPERPRTLLFVLGLLGAGLVAAGVSGELWEESQIAKLETCIRRGDDALFLVLSKEAGDAEASARQAAKASSEAKADAKTARDEADAATTASREAQTVASGAKTSASEAQDKVASVSKQAGDIDDQLKLALSMLSVRKVRDPKRMKELVAKYAGWPQPVVVKSYVGDWEGLWACLSLVEGLSVPESPGMLKQTGAGCGAEPIPSDGIPINGIALHMGTPVTPPVLMEGFRLLEILRGDGGLGNFRHRWGAMIMAQRTILTFSLVLIRLFH